jgi:soluble lytic murein transglycosylase-like protein
MLGAVLVVASNYTVAQAQGAGQTDDQAALAVPRIELRGAPGVALPQPLSPAETARVQRIFALQESGSLAEATRETGQLDNDLLLGAILADRYQRGGASAAELAAWLARFGDQPEASAVRGLLERVTPATEGPAPPPLAHHPERTAPSQARLLFVQNRDADAMAAAQAPQAGTEALYAGGLAAARLRQREAAARMFDAAYRIAPTRTLRAASAFWAGHIGQLDQDRGRFAIWMRRAAQQADTFYGLIARRALSPSPACMPGEVIGNADLDAVLATGPGRRAFALLQVGEKRLAEAELRALWLDTARDGTLDRSIMLTARAVGFTRLASDIEESRAARPAGAGLTPLRPASGFLVDPPLVYALVRQESNFHAAAVSQSGARGLMQIMPATAQAVAGGHAERLQDPAVNLAIGQQYLLALAADEAIDGDLIRILASYGQGQSGLRKWVDVVRDDGDPLMFLEAIPNSFTRASVQDALVYAWQYAAQLHLPAWSLDALATGRYPRLVRAAAGASEGPCAMMETR